MIRLKKLSELDFENYNAIIDDKRAENEEYTIAHNPILPKLLSNIFNYKQVYYQILSNENVIGYLIGCEINNRFVSVPHFSYGGPISTQSVNIRMEKVINKFEIRSFQKLADNFSVKKIATYICLEKTAEEQLKKFKYNIRRQIKIAKSELVIKSGNENLLDDFFLVYSQNMRRLGSPPQPKHFFNEFLTNYEFGESLLFCAYYNGICVGGSFYLSYKEIAEICWSATDWEYSKYFVPYLLHWKLIKFAIEQNVKVFSFGRSSENSGTLQFKRHWKPEEKKIYYNYSEPYHSNEVYKRLIAMFWTKFIPTRVGVFLGERFTKYLY